jgi:hypothetical protein
MMFRRALWAFTWLRWRVLVNSLKSAQRRDAVERVSRVAAFIIPGLFLASAFSTVAASIGLGAFGGWYSVAHPEHAGDVLEYVQLFLLLITVFAVLVPLFVGAHGGAGRVTRFMLLPIPRRTLHGIETFASLTDPWMVFVLPGLLAYAGGFIAGAISQPEPELGRFYAAGAVAVVAAAGLALVLASISSMVAFLVSWLVRDRRRGEIFVLVFIVALSGASLAPAFLSRSLEGRLDVGDGHSPCSERSPEGARISLHCGPGQVPQAARSNWVMGELPAWTRVLPSELYGAAIGAVMEPAANAPWLPLAGLFAEGALFYALSSTVHRRVVESVESGRTRRSRAHTAGAAFRIPGMWPGSSAVAVAQVRTAMRSVRGRLVVLLPGPIVAMLAITFGRIHAAGTFESILATRGYAAFGAGIIFALYAAQAFTMNQFGSDRSGLTREFIAPIRDVDLVRGKAVGCGVIVGTGALLSLICAVTVAPGGSPLLWLATGLGGAAAFLVLSPVSALVSVLLPVASDLSKTGTAGNPHSIAMLAGTVIVAVAIAPAALVVALLESAPAKALLVITIWLGLAGAIGIPLLGVVAKTLRLRRENLALVAQGR